MQLEKSLYRNGVFLFVLFVAIIVWGFWPSYYAHPWQALPAIRYHVHGALMTAWLLMLIAQAYLIRSHRRAIHRVVGKVSYVLAPLVFTMFLVMIHGSSALRQLLSANPVALASAYVYLLGAAALFAAFYVLAIANRRTATTHAGYMVCTLFPIYSAGTDRAIVRMFSSTSPFDAAWAWFAGDLLLLMLAVWDWRSSRRMGTFAVAFVAMAVYHALIFATPAIPGAASFAEWVASL